MTNLVDKLADTDAAQRAGTAVERKGKTVFDLIRDQQSQFAAALPAVMTPERFTRVALTTIRTNPKLADAAMPSLLGAFHVCAQLGLEPGGPLGHAYLTGPFYNKKTQQKEVVLIVGYKGKIDLARRSGHISSIYAEAVYEGDQFDWQLGLHRDITHKPTAVDRTDPSKITHVYAVARFRDEGAEPQFVVLTREQVEYYRGRSRAGQSGPWITDWLPMALKTAVHRLCTFLPMSVEYARASQVDEQMISRVPMDADDFIDIEPERVEELPGSAAEVGSPAADQGAGPGQQGGATPADEEPGSSPPGLAPPWFDYEKIVDPEVVVGVLTSKESASNVELLRAVVEYESANGKRIRVLEVAEGLLHDLENAAAS